MSLFSLKTDDLVWVLNPKLPMCSSQAPCRIVSVHRNGDWPTHFSLDNGGVYDMNGHWVPRIEGSVSTGGYPGDLLYAVNDLYAIGLRYALIGVREEAALRTDVIGGLASFIKDVHTNTLGGLSIQHRLLSPIHSSVRHRWLSDDKMKVYVRFSNRKCDTPRTCLDIATIEVFEEDNQGKGLFTTFLDAAERIVPWEGIYIENVLGERLRGFLGRRGYLDHGTTSEFCYYKPLR